MNAFHALLKSNLKPNTITINIEESEIRIHYFIVFFLEASRPHFTFLKKIKKNRIIRLMSMSMIIFRNRSLEL